MPIVVNLDVMMAKRKMSLNELSARVDNPAIKDGQSTDRHATCSFAQRKGNVEPLCWKLAAWWFGDKEDGIEIKKQRVQWRRKGGGKGQAPRKI